MKTEPSQTGEQEASAPPQPSEPRFYEDHGLWHDRVTGQHLYTQAQYDEARHDAAVLAQQEMEMLAARRAPQPVPAEPPPWQPMESAPRDGKTYILVTNAHASSSWIAHWEPVAVSGYRFDQPWRSVMLNHWHITPKDAQYLPPTHWMPLPAIAATPLVQPPPTKQVQALMMFMHAVESGMVDADLRAAYEFADEVLISGRSATDAS
jgi:hypothetical protein